MPDKRDESAAVEPMKYEDVPEDWKEHWRKLGIPEGEFPPGIDDSDFFAQFEKGAERYQQNQGQGEEKPEE